MTAEYNNNNINRTQDDTRSDSIPDPIILQNRTSLVLPDLTGFGLSFTEKKTKSLDSPSLDVPPPTPMKNIPKCSTTFPSDIEEKFKLKDKQCVISLISKSRSSRVYLVTKSETLSFVLKQVIPAQISSTIPNVKKEFMIAKMFDHPSLVKYQDLFITPERVIFQMEYCSLGSLQLLLSRESLRGEQQELPEVWDILLDLLCGLDALHRASIVHLDIKPGNIFITPDIKRKRRVKIGDFGTCVYSGSLVSEDGDGVYIAPELVKSHNVRADPRNDIFSLGVTLYEMGTHCDMNSQIWTKLQDVGQRRELQWERMSEKLQEVVARAVQGIDERPSVSALLQEPALKEVAKKHGVVLPPVTAYPVNEESNESCAVSIEGRNDSPQNNCCFVKERNKTRKPIDTELISIRRRLFT